MELEGDEEMETPAAPPGYDSSTSGGVGGGFRYRECQKNHAVGIRGHAVDGCCEFMAGGEEGSLEGLKCAACGCHRNFHRKEPLAVAGGGGFFYRSPPAPSGYLHVRPLALPEAADHVSNPSSSGGGGSSGMMMMTTTSKKRFRTKFSQEQKEKMLDFAERVGWRIQKHDEPAVDRFCSDTGVHRQVLKVWMHNNKHTLGKKP